MCLLCVCVKCAPERHAVPPRWLTPKRVCRRCARGLILQKRHHGVYPHVFLVAQLYTPTSCQHCGRFIFGLVNQAQRCHDCALVVHHQCVNLVPASCTVPKAAISMAEMPLSRVRQGVLSDSLRELIQQPPPRPSDNVNSNNSNGNGNNVAVTAPQADPLTESIRCFFVHLVCPLFADAHIRSLEASVDMPSHVLDEMELCKA